MEPPLTEKQTCLVSTKTNLNASVPNFDHMILTHSFLFPLPPHPSLVNFIPATLTEIHQKNLLLKVNNAPWISYQLAFCSFLCFNESGSNHHNILNWNCLFLHTQKTHHHVVGFLRSYQMLMPHVAGEWYASCHIYRTGQSRMRSVLSDRN